MKPLFMTAKEVAAWLGVSEATISRAAHGEGLHGVRPIMVLRTFRWPRLALERVFGADGEGKQDGKQEKTEVPAPAQQQPAPHAPRGRKRKPNRWGEAVVCYNAVVPGASVSRF